MGCEKISEKILCKKCEDNITIVVSILQENGIKLELTSVTIENKDK